MAAVIFLLGGVGLLTVILGMASPDSHILEAERIVIKDRAGKVRAAFGVMDSSGSPGLVLYDPEANANVVLNLGADQEPGLWLYNKDRLRGALTVKGDRSLLELFDKENHRRLVLGVYHDSKPGMELYDDKDNLRAAIGRTALDLKRANVSEQHLVAPVTLWDERGNLVWHAP
jgi:hypothetical protein